MYRETMSLVAALAAAAFALSAGCGDDEMPAESSSTRGDASMDGAPGEETELACDSTWKAIQTTVLEGRGCTNESCHDGSEPAGGLDLRADEAYDNLILKPASADLDPVAYRVQPGEQALSFLYRKLEAATLGHSLDAAEGAPMPAGGVDPLTEEELAAVRLWIRAGAPSDGVVAGTQELLDCELPELADPNKSPPPPLPGEDEGFRHVSGPWGLEPDSEDEVCFYTYYDLGDSAPEWAKLRCTVGDREQECVATRRKQLSQDAQSHHSVIRVYGGEAPPDDPSFGSWRCVGGDREGESCAPADLGACGEQGLCQTEPVSRITCNGFGPPDLDTHSVGVGGAQAPVTTSNYPEGVYEAIPIRGVVGWNSHAFNLTTQPTTIEQYHTFWYARPEERVHEVRAVDGGEYVFEVYVEPYQQQEVCASYTLPQYARLIELSSHVHKRGVLWRTWLPPNQPDCTPDSDDAECGPSPEPADYTSRLYNDPVNQVYDPPLVFDDPDPTSRTLKYCAVFDNGKEHPELLKRASEVPDGANGCTRTQLSCAGGDAAGEPCTGDESVCGEGGSCDACPVVGGVTTEDEMFILVGSYYVVEPEADETEEEAP